MSGTAVVVIKMPHRPIFRFRGEHLGDKDDRPIQPTPILPCCVFTRCETNAASIGTIIANCVTCQLIAHKHAKPEDHPHTVIISIQDKRVSTIKLMQFTTVSIAVRQNPTRTICSIMLQRRLMCFSMCCALMHCEFYSFFA